LILFSKPPREATSATPGTVCKANFTYQSCSAARLNPFHPFPNGTKICPTPVPSGLKWELHFVATVAEHNLNVPVLRFLPNKDLHYLQNDVDKTHPKHGRSPDIFDFRNTL
jgi:hypothetical protein